MQTNSKHGRLALALALPLMVLALTGSVQVKAQSQATAQASTAAGENNPYIVEWVYKVRWGYSDEFFDIFRKYQIPILDRLQQLGYVSHYTVYRPSLHTGEDERWDYTVLIVYRDQQASTHEAEVSRQLFPDRATLRREENHRWTLVESHWDLPIHAIDPHGSDE